VTPLPTFCVVGSLNMDFVVPAPKLPQEGAILLGGKGANQAAGIARLGESVSLIGKVGGDDFEGTLRTHLSEAGVNVAVDRAAWRFHRRSPGGTRPGQSRSADGEPNLRSLLQESCERWSAPCDCEAR
jgi:hypothetical protein